MKTFIHLVSVLILSIVLFACSNAHFLKEEDYRNQVTKDFEQKTTRRFLMETYLLFCQILTCLCMSRKL